MHRGPLHVVPDPAERPASALLFAETVRTVCGLARRGRLSVPVFRSPPRRADVDRTIRRRPGAVPVVSIRLDGRPVAAVQGDVIEGVVVANELCEARADRFRRAAWQSLGGPRPTRSDVGPLPPGTPARVA